MAEHCASIKIPSTFISANNNLAIFRSLKKNPANYRYPPEQFCCVLYRRRHAAQSGRPGARPLASEIRLDWHGRTLVEHSGAMRDF
jgi:hypothetical protein